MTGYTEADLAAPPAWITTPAGEAALVKGRLIVCVIAECEAGYVISSQGDVVDVRGDRAAAVALCEKLAARWYPNDKKPTITSTPAPGTKTGEGKKVVSSNRFAAPV